MTNTYDIRIRPVIEENSYWLKALKDLHPKIVPVSCNGMLVTFKDENDIFLVKVSDLSPIGTDFADINVVDCKLLSTFEEDSVINIKLQNNILTFLGQNLIEISQPDPDFDSFSVVL